MRTDITRYFLIVFILSGSIVPSQEHKGDEQSGKKQAAANVQEVEWPEDETGAWPEDDSWASESSGSGDESGPDDNSWGDEGDWGDDSGWGDEGNDAESPSIRSVLDQLPFELSGYLEARGGLFTQKNRHIRRDASIGEVRLQLEASKYIGDSFRLYYKGDSVYDAVLDETEWETREGNISFTPPAPLNNADVKIGRQILTWGTGDLLFINDLFPKNWVSFFIGRDSEYLKSPSDALKTSLFFDIANIDFVYVPRFNPDVYIDGERISYWNNLGGTLAGQDSRMHDVRKDTWFNDDEFHLRLYRTLGSYEAAIYGYWGYWKSPGGMDLVQGEAIFPRLNVYGASIRGPLLSGIGTIETGYYESRDDMGGHEKWIKNSEFRLLAGYEREIGYKFTAAVQYYLEHMINYNDYRRSGPQGIEKRDENRHLFTLRLTKLLMMEDLQLSLFTYFSPSDHDIYIRPNVLYKFNDNLQGEVGGNVFAGEDRHSFFGQFSPNTNVYMGIRYNF